VPKQQFEDASASTLMLCQKKRQQQLLHLLLAGNLAEEQHLPLHLQLLVQGCCAP
jgi:hypothetical protein